VSIEEILAADSGRAQPRRRVGRGAGSGNGKTCGRGHKGEGARSGSGRGPLFEGGQMPLWMRLPRRGFTNSRHAVRYQPIALARALERVDGDVIDAEHLVAAGLAHRGERLKLVGGIAVERKLTVRLPKVTASVRRAVEDAGGTVEEGVR